MLRDAATQDAPVDPGNSGVRSQDPKGALIAILAFFALAFGWSWGIGVAATQVSAQMPVMSTVLMMVLIALALLLADSVRRWLNRVVHPHRDPECPRAR